MKRVGEILIFLFVVLSLNSASAAVTTIDFYNQFPDTQGQNGFYAYGYRADRATPYRELERTGSYAFSTPANDYSIPYVKRGSSPWVDLHPAKEKGVAYGVEDAVLAWQAPQDNTYIISGEFHNFEGVGTVVVSVRCNDTVLLSQTMIPLGSVPFNLTKTLKAGDKLYFGVNAGDTDANDTTQLSGQIQYTPRPMTTLDLWNVFPDYQGQNGFYAYGYQAGREVPYRQLTRGGSYYFNTPVQDYNIPYWERSGSPWLTMAPSATNQTGTVYGPENAVLGWRVPQTTAYALTGQFRLHPDYGWGPVTVYLRRNNDVPLWSAVLDGLSSVSADFDLPAVALTNGDMLYFGVDAGEDDANDTSQLRGAISYTPPPAAEAAYFLLLLD